MWKIKESKFSRSSNEIMITTVLECDADSLIGRIDPKIVQQVARLVADECYEDVVKKIMSSKSFELLMNEIRLNITSKFVKEKI